jgi:hypothetical protein
MKQCPVCEKTFDDSLRFCQVDGTPLVDKAEPVDPYKTMVASKEEIAAAMPKAPAEVKPEVPEPAVPAPLENEVLEIPPAVDPNKTQVVTEEELRAEMAKISNDEDSVIDVPPARSQASETSTPPSPLVIHHRHRRHLLPLRPRKKKSLARRIFLQRRLSRRHSMQNRSAQRPNPKRRRCRHSLHRQKQKNP